MLQRKLLGKTLPCLSNILRLGYANKFSSDAIKDDKDTSSNTETVTGDSSENDPNTVYDAEELSRLLQDSATYEDAKDTDWATSPYPQDAPIPTAKESRVKTNPADTATILFPGQGTIKVGAVKKYLRFPQAKELFEIANEVLGYDLLKICLEGPQEKLNRTQFNQPATVVMSLAALEQLHEERPTVFENCMATAGYSVGEITALIFSGAMTFENGIRLVNVRGTAMQYASERTPQGMISVYCRPQAKVSKICGEAQQWALNMGVENPVCRTAIYLYTQSKILAGNNEALQYIEQNAEKVGLARLQRLPVSGAFHTPLMEPALKAVYKMLSSIEIEQPRCRVYSNFKGLPYNNLKFMKKYILKQIVSPVRWEQCMQDMYNRPIDTPFPRIFDVGSEGRMKTILKFINSKAALSCIVV